MPAWCSIRTCHNPATVAAAVRLHDFPSGWLLCDEHAAMLHDPELPQWCEIVAVRPVSEFQHAEADVLTGDVELLVQVIRLRLRGWTYPQIDRVLFLDDRPDVKGRKSWALVETHRADLDRVLPKPAEAALQEEP